MNLGFRYLICLCIPLIATQAFAADMSGWSDKTVCRLVNSGGQQEYIDEAKARGVVCGLPVVNSGSGNTGVKPANPLDALSIPPDWKLIKDVAAFNDERSAHIAKAYYNPSEFEIKCYEVLKDWQKNVRFGDKSQFQGCGQSLNIFGYVGFSPHDEQVPGAIQELFLHWAKTNALKPPPDRGTRNFSSFSYDTNTFLGSYAAYYGVFHKHFGYSDFERELVERMFVQNLLSVEPKDLLPIGEDMCNPYSLAATAQGLNRGRMNSNTCGSILWSQMQGQLVLGLRLGNTELFNKGIETVKWNLRFIDKDGIFIPYAAAKGGHAIDYMDTVPQYLGVLTEIFATVNYDFLSHKIPSGITIKEVLDGLADVYGNHKILLKYNRTNSGKYGGHGWTVAQYRKWTPTEAMSMASYSWTLFARQVPRYVDRYRPDLQQYRTLDFIPAGENGQGIDNITGHGAIDPYMLYEANYLAAIDVDLSYKSSDQVSPFYEYHSPGERYDPSKGEFEGKAKRLASEYTFDDNDTVINSDPTQCDFQILRHLSQGERDQVIALGKIVVIDGLIKFSEEEWFTGSASQLQQILENQANLRMMKKTGLTGGTPLYAMFTGNNDTPEPATYVEFGSALSEFDTQLEGRHDTFLEHRAIGFTLDISGCVGN